MNISIKNASVTIDGNNILENVNFEIKNNEPVAIVGRNGAGKTTLLKAIIDNSLFESGIGEEEFQITKIGKCNIGYLKQNSFSNDSITLIDEILKSYAHLIKMEKRLSELIDEMNDNEDAILEYTDLLEKFKLLGGYSYKKEYEVMLKKFGFTESDKNKLLKNFSGGQKTKIAFIKLLISKPDLLILDEPTNHLDIEAITWLEDYLRKYKGAIIIVSHDRMFIQNICNIIYDISYGKTTKYVGSYEEYEKQKRLNYEKTLNDYEFQQKEIQKLRSIYEKNRFKPTKASLAMSRLKQLEKMEILEKPRKEDTRVFNANLKEIKGLNGSVINIKNASFGYDKELCNLNLNINSGTHLGIIGPNGIGKSTILKTLNNLITPLSGKINYNPNINIGYFDQNLIMNSSDNTVLEEFMESFPEYSVNTRNALGSFLFKGDDVFKKIDVLSGGEKVRLQLCKMFYRKPNVLILDEVTNHLDIIGKEHLEEILESYNGTIIFVSHDRYFIKKIAKQLLVFEDGNIKYYNCGYDDYLRKISENQKEETKIVSNVKQVKKHVNNYNKDKEIKKLESIITKLENEIKELKESMFLESVYSEAQKLQEVNKRIEELQKELELKNEEWASLII